MPMHSWENPLLMSKEERMESRREFYRPRTVKELVDEMEERILREEEYREE